MAILKMWVCNVEGCKKRAFKRIWLDVQCRVTEQNYKILVDVCKEHYNDEKRADPEIKDVLLFKSAIKESRGSLDA